VLARRYKAIQGLTIPAAQNRRGTTSLDAQIDLILEMAKNGGASIILYEMNENDLLPFLRRPETMFASDSGVFQTKTESQHPRGYGNAAHVLARYVRAEKQLPLEEAIRRMTSLAASTFQLKDRGEIREGAWADLVVFDPATVQDRPRSRRHTFVPPGSNTLCQWSRDGRKRPAHWTLARASRFAEANKREAQLPFFFMTSLILTG
jgi:N-acyl-D-amino-acid deacylase